MATVSIFRTLFNSILTINFNKHFNLLQSIVSMINSRSVNTLASKFTKHLKPSLYIVRIYSHYLQYKSLEQKLLQTTIIKSIFQKAAHLKSFVQFRREVCRILLKWMDLHLLFFKQMMTKTILMARLLFQSLPLTEY